MDHECITVRYGGKARYSSAPTYRSFYWLRSRSQPLGRRHVRLVTPSAGDAQTYGHPYLLGRRRDRRLAGLWRTARRAAAGGFLDAHQSCAQIGTICTGRGTAVPTTRLEGLTDSALPDRRVRRADADESGCVTVRSVRRVCRFDQATAAAVALGHTRGYGSCRNRHWIPCCLGRHDGCGHRHYTGRPRGELSRPAPPGTGQDNQGEPGGRS